jgi:hypothetical protein
LTDLLHPPEPRLPSPYNASGLVPDIFDCSLDGRPYMIDESQPFYRQHRRQLEPIIRTQADTSPEPGEQTLDPNGLWRRSFEDWRMGMGQRYLDRQGSLDNSYFWSKGLNTLQNAWELHMLPGTIVSHASTGTNLQLLWAAAYMYIVDGANLYYSPISAISRGQTVTWATIAGLPGTNISSACTDGYLVYLACGAQGVWTVGPGGASAGVHQLVTSAIDSAAVVGYGNGRLMLGSTNNLYNIVSSTAAALPTPLMVSGNPNARWTCFTGGNNWLYGGLNVGGVGHVYGVQTTADGTTLAPPVVQALLPNGEKVFSMYGYEGYLFLGTQNGVRACTQGANGVTIGTLIPVGTWGTMPSSTVSLPPYGNAVQCFAAWRDRIYFGWTDYDTTSTGLGQLSLENWAVAGILPACASDLMANVQGAVTGVAVVNDAIYVGQSVLLFAVQGQGVFLEDINLVPSGTVQSGYVLYDLTDPKVPALLDVQGAFLPQQGSCSAAVSVDGGSFVTVGSASPGSGTVNTYSLQPALGSGSRFEVALTLSRDPTSTNAGPTITRWTMRSWPAPIRPKTWQLPLVLSTHVEDVTGQDWPFQPEVEINALEAMANDGLPVAYQEGNETYTVFVTDVSFISRTRGQTIEGAYFEGLALVNIESVPA